MAQADSEPITAETFAAFASWLGTPLPENPIRALRILRREAAAEIERLLVFLDATDSDPDLEPTMGHVAGGYLDEAEGDDPDAEPSLGAYEEHPGPWTAGSQLHWSSGNRDDLEGERAQEDDEDGGDDEQSLGWQSPNPGRVMCDGSEIWPQQAQVRDPGFDQTSLGMGLDGDLEDEFDGREPDVDDEDGHDREDDHAEKFGIADQHALEDPGMNLGPGGCYLGDGTEIAEELLDRAGIQRRALRPLTGPGDNRSW